MGAQNRRIALMGLWVFFFFLVGAIDRALDLDRRVEWLRGLPQIAGALMLYTPIVFSIPNIRRKEFWSPGRMALLRLLVLLLLFGTGTLALYFGIRAYLQ